jgi:hypothetical protein
VIPAKRGKKTWRVHGVRAEMRRAFPQRIYRRRALIESLFSSVKRKLSARAPGRSLPMQMRQALLLGLSFNMYRLKHRRLFPRMSTEPRHFNGNSRNDGNQCRLGPRWRSHVASVPPPHSAFSGILTDQSRLLSGKGSLTASRPGPQSMLFSVNYFFHSTAGCTLDVPSTTFDLGAPH